MFDVALKIPLRLLPFCGSGQRHDPRDTRVEVLRDPLYGAALAGRVPPLEDHDEPHTLDAHPLLELHQFSLQPEQLLLVLALRQPLWTAVAGSRTCHNLGVLPVLRALASHRRDLPRARCTRHGDVTAHGRRSKDQPQAADRPDSRPTLTAPGPFRSTNLAEAARFTRSPAG